MVLEWLLHVEQVVDLVSPGCLCFHNFNFYWSSAHHEMCALETSLCEVSGISGLGFALQYSFWTVSLIQCCVFGVWHEEILRKLTPRNLHLGKMILIWESFLESWQLLASLCAEAQPGIIPSLWESFCIIEDLGWKIRCGDFNKLLNKSSKIQGTMSTYFFCLSF